MPGKLVWGVLLALLAGCEERERLVFETEPEDHTGPVAEIHTPSTDTTLIEGDPFVLGGRLVDPSGVDTLYIQVLNANISYLPLPGDGEDTLNFAISVPTQTFGGRTIIIGVYGVDLLGNVGPTVARRLTIE